MPEISFPYQQRHQITEQLSAKTGFIWLHTRLTPGENVDLLAWEPEWTETACRPEDLAGIYQRCKASGQSDTAGHSFFDGGLAGYIGYNFSRRQNIHRSRTGFSNHEAENSADMRVDPALPPDVYIAYYPTNYIVIDHSHQTMSGDVADPALIDCSWRGESQHQHPGKHDETLAAAIPGSTAADNFQLLSPFQAQWSARQYHQAYQQIKEYILAGDCYQVNLTQKLSATYQGDPFSIFREIIKIHRTPHAAYLKTGHGDILCFSPESFLSINNQRICTKPIKGTRKRSTDPVKDRDIAEELLNSTKDRAENVMIVDLLRNDLGRIAKTSTVSVKQLCELESFSNVHHLVSTICAELKDSVSPLEALLACSPGGSITGAPKVRAMEIIDEVEDFSRNAYCGSIFHCGHNHRLESNIAIRTLTCRDGHISIWGGGGIVADSREEEEYRESLFKIQHLIDLLEATLTG